MAETLDEVHWYLIHTKTREEGRAENNLNVGRIETFTPRMRPRRPGTRRGEVLFPGYLFARFSLAKRLPDVRFARGVVSVVAFGEGPVQVDDLYEMLRARVESDGTIRLLSPSHGERVQIVAGPLRALRGVLAGPVSAKERVSILLTAAAYQARVIVDRDDVSAAPR